MVDLSILFSSLQGKNRFGPNGHLREKPPICHVEKTEGISNIEQGILNVELKNNSTFKIPCSIFDIYFPVPGFFGITPFGVLAGGTKGFVPFFPELSLLLLGLGAVVFFASSNIRSDSCPISSGVMLLGTS